MHKEKFMVYRRDAKKGEATYSPKSHSAPHFEGHYVEGMEFTVDDLKERKGLKQFFGFNDSIT